MYSENSAAMSFGFYIIIINVKNLSALQSGKDRVCITAHICSKFGCVLEFRGVCSRGIRKVILIYCIGLFPFVLVV